MMPLVFAENGEENIIKKVGGTPETKKWSRRSAGI